VLAAHERNACAQVPQFCCQHFRHPQGHLAFFHRWIAAHLEPAFLHLGPFAADMSGIKRDAYSRENAPPSWLGKRLRCPPAARRSAFLLVPSKTKSEPSLRVLVHEDAREISLDANELIADSVAAIDVS